MIVVCQCVIPLGALVCNEFVPPSDVEPKLTLRPSLKEEKFFLFVCGISLTSDQLINELFPGI